MNTATSSWFCPSRARAYRTLRRFSDRGTFWMFPFLPLEIQIMVLSYASPSPQIVPLRFQSDFDDWGNLVLSVKVLPDPYLTPLMKACCMFNAEINRDYKKIGVQPFGSNTDTKIASALKEISLSIDQDWEANPDIEFKFVTSGFKRVSLKHVYLHPVQDTLYMNFREIFLLYSLGGSVNMSNVTNLALFNVAEHVWDYTWLGFEDIEAKYLMYGMISQQCPALQKLSLLLRYQKPFLNKEDPERKIDADHIIFEIDEDFADLPFENKAGLRTLGDPPAMAELCAQVKKINSEFRKCLISSDAKYELDEKALQFWQKRAPVPSLIARLDRDEKWRARWARCAEPRIYLRDIKAYLPCDVDGTYLHEYKGLAQLFDGAPW